ncbi:complex I NDUFA9 subunit family protein [Chitinimonas sp. BJB300]|uniref:complex I NDUFA9 subunit family protein n=1 Tax=Chitinimonas sp. BJB300 TaxID=1559339 RepID=UPI000C0DBF85|nr:complex I NDUFA9 subunit family protein [Chitinimonas sp. BJB300]PHV13067.1 NAD-dependent dehydratase [Chitinimonas sp. BJB300]TSJ87723.1 complex I NDUFA9 subunit family protein [Chitinimonas sp. BJB300]
MPIPSNTRILVIGGTGFIGCSLVERLAARGHTVTLPCRNREKVREDLIPLPGVTVLDADVHNPKILAELMVGHAVVINLVGILHGSRAQFHRAHVELTEKIMAAMQQAGVRRYLHMSSLGANTTGPSHYLQTKGEAEAKVRNSDLDWTIFRPAVVFGSGICFLSKFASLVKMAPLIPLAGASARMQPVWVEDVSRAFVRALEDDSLRKQSLSLVGPTVYTLQELMQYVGQTAGTPRPVIAIPDWAGRLQAAALSILPNPPLSSDNLNSLKVDSVDPAGFAPLLGWRPTALEAIAPMILANGRARDRYLALRKRHRHI